MIKQQKGVTVVEIGIVIAITSIMVSVIFTQVRSQQQSQFTSEVDKIYAKITEVQNEAASGVLEPTRASVGSSTNAAFYGKMIEFFGPNGSADSRRMRISTLIRAEDPTGVNQQLAKCDEKIINFDQGLEFNINGLTNQAIIFTYKHDNQINRTIGVENYTQMMPVGAPVCTGGTYTPSTAGINATNRVSLEGSAANITIRLQDLPRTAEIQVNSATNTIQRVVNP